MSQRAIRIVELALVVAIVYFVLLAVVGCKKAPEPVAAVAQKAAVAVTPTRVPPIVYTPNVVTFRANILRGGTARLIVNGAEIARIYDVTINSKLTLEMTRVEQP